ncbi:hypothetical protein RHSP_32033 [Rhizobium freirei PRF 81]|uniref:Ig-like domain-containing protein n=1 Tax=Rhizobium freirei PRF 81 TaxID=363754 RepID=N6UZE9_9HYPH|nr:hypothetical protein RHSP_32033 [Rhizobium freirei PRF 81]
MLKRLIFAAAFTAVAVPSVGQNITGNEFQTATPGRTVNGVVTMCINGSNQAIPCPTGGSTSVTQGTNPWTVSYNVPSNPKTVAGCTVGVTSSACLGSNPRNWVQMQNTSASATIACSWSGAASLNSTNSFMLAAGQSASWGPTTGGAPNQALNCIASAASSPLYVEQN